MPLPKSLSILAFALFGASIVWAAGDSRPDSVVAFGSSPKGILHDSDSDSLPAKSAQKEREVVSVRSAAPSESQRATESPMRLVQCVSISPEPRKWALAIARIGGLHNCSQESNMSPIPAIWLSSAPQPMAQGGPPKAFTPELLDAWRKPLGRPGWIYQEDFLLKFRSGGEDGNLGDMPAFKLKGMLPSGIFAKVPVPDRPFGLEGAALDDASLKELASLEHLQALMLDGSGRVTDGGLLHLTALKELRYLSLGHRITDAGLVHLTGLKNLKALLILSVQDQLVTDAGLRNVAKLRALETLVLRLTVVTDKGIKELRGLEHLQNLSLLGTRVSDAGIGELAHLKELRSLDLGLTDVTGAGLKQLAGLNHLKSISLRAAKVTDAGLQALAELKHLESVDLTLTVTTDAGLTGLARLKKLETLRLVRAPNVTEGGISLLHEALPKLRIIR